MFILSSSMAVQSASVWSENLTIESIFTEDSNLIVVNTSGGVEYTEGCKVNRWVFVSENEHRMNRVYSTLLAALASERPIKIYNRDECGNWNYHSIFAVQIGK